MASNITAQSVLAEICQGHLECPICKERLKLPKLLECSHSFCLLCLQQLRENSPSTTKLSCPLCRQITRLQKKGIDGLQTNFATLSLLKAVKKQENRLKQQESRLPAQEHQSKCEEHTDKDLIMYCDTCSSMICTTCIVQNHQFHSLLEINEAVDKCKRHATEFTVKVRQSIKTFKVAIEEIDLSRKSLEAEFAATNKKIFLKADEQIAKEVARVEKEKLKLMQEAEEIYTDRVKIMKTAETENSQNMTAEKHKLDNVNKIMKQKSQHKIVHHMKQVLTDLKEYRKIAEPTKLQHDLTYMNFREGQQSLGILELQYKMTLKAEMTKYMNAELQMVEFSPWDAAAYSNGDVVLSDLVISSLIVISNISESPQSKVPLPLPIKGLSKASRVAVNKNDELIVLDNQGVKIFNKKYQLLHDFRPGPSGSNPSCVAVSDNNLIAVGYFNKDEISLHKPDGSLVKTMPAPGTGGYLSTCRGRLVYINCGASNKLVSMNFDGEIVFSVDINQPGRPYGVCCDEDGGAYLAVWNEGSSGEIHHYSPGGTYTGCVIKDCNNPWGITITPAGDLVVAAGRSVQIYHR